MPPSPIELGGVVAYEERYRIISMIGVVPRIA
jgi:hypothetical protein